MTDNDNIVERLIAPTPSDRQYEWQQLEYYNFVHFGMCTFIGKEWGKGTESPRRFAPKNLDTDQWCEAFKASGSRGVILTAKHHDGFCLWQTKTTEHSVKNSPYKDGKGDVVRELAQSCKKYGLKLGLYLSPWDRNCPVYGSDAYNDFYCEQLKELLTNYGELFCLWFDGACGEGPNGKKQRYDFKRYYELIRELQPNACISITGPDVRWIGNESGTCREEEWSVCPARFAEYETIAEGSQHEDKGELVTGTSKNIGSRELLAKEKDLIWYPAEMDVPITRRYWFWRKSAEYLHLRTTEELLGLYYSSVGHNSSLLLNVPANKKGLIPDRYVSRLKEFGDALKKDSSKPIDLKETKVDEYTVELNFEEEWDVLSVVLQEDIRKSQRVESFTIECGGETVYSGKTIGYKQICLFRDKAVVTDKLTLKISGCRSTPRLLPIEVYAK